MSPTEKLDVNGNIQFNGTLLVGTTPSNGTSGQVLTSQGSANPPQWVSPISPVYVSARKNSDTSKTASAGATAYQDVDGMTIESQSGSNYNATTGVFTAPRTAIYVIDYATNVIDDAPTYTQFLATTVQVNRGSGFNREMSQNYSDTNKETVLFTLRTTYMTQLNVGDTVKSELEIFNSSGTIATIRGHSTTPRCTFQSIHSIT